MNEVHLQLLASPEWAAYLRDELLPWVLGGVELGDHVLEVGPGPGLTTDVLRQRVPRLTAVELDPHLAEPLADRLAGTNVEVTCVDATRLDAPDDSYSAAVCFTMLHHVPTSELQDRLFAEMARVVQPSGVFAGSDSAPSDDLRAFHEDDVYNPIDPKELPDRLTAVGFTDVEVEARDGGYRFRARPTGSYPGRG